MKVITILPVTLLGVLLFSSCKKDTPATSTEKSYRPKTYTETITSSVLGNSVTTYNLSYDANNRIVSLADASSAGNRFVYQYSNNNYTLDLYEANTLSIHEVFYINSLSYVDSTFQYNNTNDSTTEKYFYNAQKQLVKLNEYDYSKTTGGQLTNVHNYTYDNTGNVIQDVDYNGTTSYTYYSNLLNTLSLGQTYFPQTLNLAKTTTYSSGGSTISDNQTYTFDSSNRLSSEKDVLSTGDILIKSYTY